MNEVRESIGQAATLAVEGSPSRERRVRLYVWQAPVRITHWVTAGCIVALSLTGGYIADPFLIPAGGSVMATVRTIHIVAALLFLVSGVVRTIWLLTGNRFARWTAFIPTSRRQATELFRQAAFYAFLRREIPKVLGHNQLAATAYLLLFVLLLVETVTGFALDGSLGSGPSATLFGWLWELHGDADAPAGAPPRDVGDPRDRPLPCVQLHPRRQRREERPAVEHRDRLQVPDAGGSRRGS